MKCQKLRSMIQIFLENYMQDFMKACVTFNAQGVNLSNKRHFIIIKFVYVTFSDKENFDSFSKRC